MKTPSVHSHPAAEFVSAADDATFDALLALLEQRLADEDADIVINVEEETIIEVEWPAADASAADEERRRAPVTG